MFVTDPTVSVVMPVFNSEDTIVRAVMSVLAQTAPDFELIVVDDASTDASSARLDRINDERIWYVRLPENRGACAARNVGLEMARGTWVAFMDADDCLDPRRLEVLCARAEQLKADIIADNIFLVHAFSYTPSRRGVVETKDGRTLHPSTLHAADMQDTLPRPIDAAEFVLGNLAGPNSLRLGLLKPMFRRSFLLDRGLRWDEQVQYGQDFVFFTHCLAAGSPLWMLSESYYYYTANPNGITKTAPMEASSRHRLNVNERLARQYRSRRHLRRALQVRRRHLLDELERARFRTTEATHGLAAATVRYPRQAGHLLRMYAARRASNMVQRMREHGVRATLNHVRRRIYQ
ncbi:MAG: glycosyltransferase [Bacteroidota bacterium]